MLLVEFFLRRGQLSENSCERKKGCPTNEAAHSDFVSAYSRDVDSLTTTVLLLETFQETQPNGMKALVTPLSRIAIVLRDKAM